jgi:hypothetical protein
MTLGFDPDVRLLTFKSLFPGVDRFFPPDNEGNDLVGENDDVPQRKQSDLLYKLGSESLFHSVNRKLIISLVKGVWELASS